MRYLSLFSGIEAASVAWKPLGWECVAVSEIERFPCAVLAHHYPDVPNLGDVTKITEDQIRALGQIDLVVFGSPCQDLSIAGKRKGLQGSRSGLFHAAIEIVRWARKHGGCRFALWENVPGAYSSNQGRDFACVVGEMAGLADVGVPAHGWGTEGCAVGDDGMVEWCCLDAQWFGVAQRRRRVFALADFGAWWDRGPILLEPNSMRRDTAPSREAGQETAGTLASRTGAGGFPGTDEACSGYLQAFGGGNTGPLDTDGSTHAVCVTGDITHTLKAEGFDASEDGTGRGQPIIAFQTRGSNIDIGEISGTLGANSGSASGSAPMAAYSVALRGRDGGATAELGDEVAGCLRASTGGGDKPHVLATMAVRRLMPVECEALQAFPRGYTGIPGAADGPRYKALGNSMCVNVMAFIGRRIQQETV